VSQMRETLIFGPGFTGDTPLDPMVAVAASPGKANGQGCSGDTIEPATTLHTLAASCATSTASPDARSDG
ncbi:MAG: hypothetical protein AAF565_18005, partial [Pseudomonadota bacterium]